MMKITLKVKAILLVAVFLTLAVIPAFAQGPGFEEDVDDVPVPFDGGVALIAAAVAGYGIKKLKKRNK